MSPRWRKGAFRASASSACAGRRGCGCGSLSRGTAKAFGNARAAARGLERSAAAIARRIANLLEMVETGMADPKASGKRFNELVAEQREIERALAEAESPDAIELHPQAAERYRAKVADIHAAIRSGDSAAYEAIAIVRDLIDHILVNRRRDPIPWDLRSLATSRPCSARTQRDRRWLNSLVAGARLGQFTYENGQRRTNPAPLGCWGFLPGTRVLQRSAQYVI